MACGAGRWQQRLPERRQRRLRVQRTTKFSAIPPGPDHFRVGATTAFNGKSYSVTSNQQVMLISAQGELPYLPELGRSFAMVELRSRARVPSGNTGRLGAEH
jgi:hypothetical protein